MTTDRCVCFYESDPPCPFCAEDNRDLHADLAICNAATVGPWIYSDWPGSVNVVTPSRRIITSVYGMDEHEANARGIFIAAARTGWPHAIERALAAEAEVARLTGNCQALYDTLMEALEYVPGEWTEDCREIAARIRADIFGEEATTDDSRT